jgi:glyoxylase-like metal-dependent hydrolase (beta-lactamase superfamily II)
MVSARQGEVPAFICVTCGTQYPPGDSVPTRCAICDEPRQYVGFDGQRWTTLDELRRTHRTILAEEEPGVLSIRTDPPFAIGQRAFLVTTPGGNVLWDCVALLDEPTTALVQARGGLAAIAISHPHFYTTMAEWSARFGGAPVYLHEADREWVVRPHAAVRHWSGRTLDLPGGLRLVHTPGHFAGSQVLHWPAGAGGRGVLFSGDQPQVCPDRRWVSFMYSYPNLALGPRLVEAIVAALDALEFDRIYGAFHPRTVATDARRVLAASRERYMRAVSR